MPSSTKLVLRRRAAHLGGGPPQLHEIPLGPQVVQAIRRRLPPGSDPAALLFTGPGGGPGQRGSPGVKKGTRTVVSRHNFRRTYHGALASLREAAANIEPYLRAVGTRIWSLTQLERQLRPEAYRRRRGGYLHRRRIPAADA